jgi:transposase
LNQKEEAKTCDRHGNKTLLPESMWDVREQLLYIPGTLKIIVRKCPKYACQAQPDCGIVTAERPTGIVEGHKYDASVATQIIVNKDAWHLPLYRQQDMFAAPGGRLHAARC